LAFKSFDKTAVEYKYKFNRYRGSLGIHCWTQTGKGIYIRTLCQTNELSVETKQRPTKMGGRITYWTLPVLWPTPYIKKKCRGLKFKKVKFPCH
jgi:hypothetical protein